MTTSVAREIRLDEREFARIAALLKDRAGIHLPSSKQPLVHSRLSKRLRGLNLPDFAAYVDLVESPSGADELIEMISALTTNVTSFFREKHHFDYLRTDILPPLLEQARKGGRVRIWSAGCSTGQEPYSLAMTILEMDPDAASRDLRILATDIDPQVLAKAAAGEYDEEAIAPVSKEQRKRWFENLPDENFRVRPALARLITFRELNLAIPWPVRGPFDVIFCRNVAIYFDRTVQERVWSGFAERLAPGGLLCIGHSERLTGAASDKFKTAGITAYIRAGQA
jgi:chemotaxis protein methyltransferase CheR